MVNGSVDATCRRSRKKEIVSLHFGVDENENRRQFHYHIKQTLISNGMADETQFRANDRVVCVHAVTQ